MKKFEDSKALAKSLIAAAKGSGTRVEALVQPSDLARLEEKIFLQFTTLGVKTFDVVRKALTRESRLVRFDGRDIRVKVATLPDGTRRAKPEFDDLRRVAEETSRPLAEIRSEVMTALNDTESAPVTLSWKKLASSAMLPLSIFSVTQM